MEYALGGPVGAFSRRLDHLDADRRVVQADCMATANSHPDDPVNGPVPADDEVCTDAGELAARWGVGREPVPRGAVAAPAGEVQHDHLRVAQPPARSPVVPPRVAGHLTLTPVPVRNVVIVHARPGDRLRRDSRELDGCVKVPESQAEEEAQRDDPATHVRSLVFTRRLTRTSSKLQG